MGVQLPVDSIADVIAVMQDINEQLPAGDGVACFNRMYLAVTERVGIEVCGETFENAEFLSRLDVRFANLYLDAWDADRSGREVARAWAPLFSHRANADVAPLQFALAGMNAHINNDLPIAVTQTCTDLGLVPKRETPHYRDFCTTNKVLGRVEGEVKSYFVRGTLAALDRLSTVDDAVEMWSIAEARNLAWDNCELLWSLRDRPHLRSAFLDSLACMVGLAGHGILL